MAEVLDQQRVAELVAERGVRPPRKETPRRLLAAAVLVKLASAVLLRLASADAPVP